jgi:hypothetical protein
VSLRNVSETDIPRFLVIQADPDAGHLGPRDLVSADAADPEAAWRAAITDRSKVLRTAEREGAVIGYVMAHDTGARFPPIAWAVDGGEGTETAIEVLRVFLDRFPRRPVRTWVDASNTRAIMVLEALEFRRIDERAASGSGEYLYELTLFPHLNPAAGTT